MKTIEEIIRSCNAIREAIDSDTVDVDINAVDNKMKKLTQLTGLSAEANASAKKFLHKKELEILTTYKDAGYPPSVLSNMLKAECFEEIALLEYCDRLNSGLVHSLDCLRSSISLYKTELQYTLTPDGNTSK